MQALITIFAALLGLAFGSFLNVCLSRWPEEESIVRPGSHCRSCSRRLAWWENLPLLSWILLGGRCRACRSWIGWRYPLVEFLVALLWGVSAWHLSAEWSDPNLTPSALAIRIAALAGRMIFYWLLVALAFLDAEHFWLPDKLTWPGILLGVGFTLPGAGIFSATVHPEASPLQMLINIPAATHLSAISASAVTYLAGIAGAAALILLIRWLYWLFRRQEGMGLGDAKLMALLAAWLGLPCALVAFAFGVLLGGIGALVLLRPAAQPEAENWAQKKLALGTFLCIGGVLSSFWGRQLIDAYLRWAGF